jgi:hypothetical protein
MKLPIRSPPRNPPRPLSFSAIELALLSVLSVTTQLFRQLPTPALAKETTFYVHKITLLKNTIKTISEKRSEVNKVNLVF